MPSSGTKKGWLAALAICGGLALLVVGVAIVVRSLGGSPFRLLIEPHNGQVYVQFMQPDAKLVSSKIPVTLHLDRRYDLVLDSASVPIPGGRVEFADTTLLPGDFKVRIGDALFDVMEREIYVDGRPSGWKRIAELDNSE